MTRDTKPGTRILTTCLTVLVAAVSLFPAGVAHAAPEPFVYPSKGQSPDQTEKDKYSCYQWAKGQTGFDPMQQQSAAAPPAQKKGGAVKGAAGGAAVGAVGGAIAGDAGKGAAIGAATGGVIGAARRNKANKEQEKQAQQQAAQLDQKRNEYSRAWGACLEGKGYSVK